MVSVRVPVFDRSGQFVGRNRRRRFRHRAMPPDHSLAESAARVPPYALCLTVLAALEQAALIVETSGRQWGRQYLARDMLRAIEMPTDAGDELGEGKYRNA